MWKESTNLQGNGTQYVVDREITQIKEMLAMEKPPKWTSVVSSFNKSGEVCTGRMFTSKNDNSSVYHSEKKKEKRNIRDNSMKAVLKFWRFFVTSLTHKRLFALALLSLDQERNGLGNYGLLLFLLQTWMLHHHKTYIHIEVLRYLFLDSNIKCNPGRNI